MKNLRYFFRLTIAFFKRFKGLLIIGIVIGVLLSIAAVFAFPKLASTSEIRIGVTGRYVVEELPLNITSKISGGLTKISNSGIPEPNIASSWETPDQGKTWIFNLSQNHWHDDKEIDSESIKYNFSDVEVEKPDSKTLIFKLENPYAAFPAVVSKPIFKQGLLGIGEWKAENLVESNGYVQELTLVNSASERIIYKFYPSEERTKLAFKLGEVEKIEDIYDPEPFLEWNTVNYETKANPEQIVTIFFNLESEAFRDNKPLRQALSYAINKEKSGMRRAISPINPNSWAYNPQVKDYAFDQERAKELIKDIPQEVIQKEIKLSTNPALLDVAEQIEKNWEEIGLNISVNVTPIIPIDYDAFLTIYDIPQDPDQYQMWHSTQTDSNLTNYGTDRIDGLLEQGRSTLELESRRRIYLDFQRFLLEDAPAVFLYHPVYYDISRN